MSTAAKFAAVAALCALALVMQLTVFAHIKVMGVAPELLLLFAIMSSVVVGMLRGAQIAFFAGLLWDVYLSSPFGLSAAIFALTAYVVGAVNKGFFRSFRIEVASLAAVATACAVTAYAALVDLMGQGDLLNMELVRIVAIASALNAFMSFICAPVVRWFLA